jgi:predicted N-formylglutamate amidohydrolase
MSTRTAKVSADVPALLAPDEPAAAERVNPEGRAPFLLVCDHAQVRVPRALKSLGLEESVLRRHIGWDIGAAEVARRLSARFDAPLVLSGYSRLVIDCNRALDDPTSIPEISEDVVIPGNRNLTKTAKKARRREAFQPYHDAIDAALDGFAARSHVPAFVAIHSFTPILKGDERPWHVGVLWRGDGRVAKPLIANLAADPDIVAGDNKPYSGEIALGHTVEHHALTRGLPNALIEIRQDLIDTQHGAAAWAERVARALEPVLLDNPGLYTAWKGKRR